jgi:hypothetical protein
MRRVAALEVDWASEEAPGLAESPFNLELYMHLRIFMYIEILNLLELLACTFYSWSAYLREKRCVHRYLPSEAQIV